MIITIDGEQYTYKTSFDEFTIDEYLSLIQYLNLPIIDKVSKYTGIAEEILNRITLESISNIIQSVAFIEDYNVLNALAEPYSGKDVGLDSFSKLEQAKQNISSLTKVVSIYTGEDISGKPLLTEWHKCQFYLKSLNAFFDRFKRLNQHQYTDEELEADVEVLEGFKHYGIVFSYGKSRGMTNDEVLTLPAIEIYTELLYDFEKSEYEKRYTDIINNRKEHFSKLV